MVAYKQTSTRCRKLAGVRLGKIHHVLKCVELTVFANNQNSRVSTPVCNRLKRCGAILDAALDRLRDEVRDVVRPQCIAVSLGLACKPVPADTPTGTWFV